MNNQEIISVYETIAVITSQMLEAARTGDWEQLGVLESCCASQVEIIRNGEAPGSLTGAVRERKVKIIQKILADDREIRTITEPWMAQLSARMNSNSAERKLSRAYGTNQPG